MSRARGAGSGPNIPETPRRKNEAAIASLMAILDTARLPSSRTIARALEQHGYRKARSQYHCHHWDGSIYLAKYAYGIWYQLNMADPRGYIVSDDEFSYEVEAYTGGGWQ